MLGNEVDRDGHLYVLTTNTLRNYALNEHRAIHFRIPHSKFPSNVAKLSTDVVECIEDPIVRVSLKMQVVPQWVEMFTRHKHPSRLGDTSGPESETNRIV